MIDEDTPRSLSYGSPRDDRFYTPRTVARSNSSSNSDEWQTPRFETPRYETPRYNYNSQSDGEFQTPRADAEKKADTRSGSFRITNDDGSKLHPVRTTKDMLPYPRHAAPKVDNRIAAINNSTKLDSKYASFKEEDEYAIVDFAASGLSEKDVEDVFSYARHGRCEEIERLFTKGLPIDVRDSFGNTVLTIACQNGNKRVAKAVLRRGANINARNYKGNTPLHYCYNYGYGDSLGQYLISKGADADARNNAGKSVWQGI